MIRGKGGQISSASFLQVFFPCRKVADSGGAVIRKQRHRSHSDENTICRTSSGSVSINIWPTSHRVKSAVVAGCCAKDVHRSIEACGLLPSAILSNGEPTVSVTPGRVETDGGGRTYSRKI